MSILLKLQKIQSASQQMGRLGINKSSKRENDEDEQEDYEEDNDDEELDYYYIQEGWKTVMKQYERSSTKGLITIVDENYVDLL